MLPERSGAADAVVPASRDHRQRLNQLTPRQTTMLVPRHEITDELHVSSP